MKAGDLRQRVELMRPIDQDPDEYGRKKPVYRLACVASADVRDVSGREFFQAAAYQMEDVITFTIRWLSAITGAWRIRYRGVEYEIIGINRLGHRGDYVQLRARACAPKGSVKL